MDNPKYRANFAVTLSKPAEADASVQYELVAGTAQPDVDYEPVSGTLAFMAGDTDSQVQVNVREIYAGDPAAFKLRLFNPIGVTLGRAEGDALLPGPSLHDLFLDSFAGGDGPLIGSQPEVSNGVWQIGSTGEEPAITGGKADFGAPPDAYRSAVAKLRTEPVPGGGAFSFKVKVSGVVLDTVGTPGEAVLGFDFYNQATNAYAYMRVDMLANQVEIGGDGYPTGHQHAVDFTGLTAFDLELRHEIDGEYTGFYLNGNWVFSLQATGPVGPYANGIDTMYLYTHGFNQVFMDDMHAEQGGPDPSHDADVIVPPGDPVFFDDTFTGAGPLIGHVPEKGAGAWQDLSATSGSAPAINVAGMLDFTGNTGSMGAQVPAGITANAGVIRLYAEINSAPPSGLVVFGLASSPMIGQSYTGAQVSLNFNTKKVGITSTYNTTEFPFDPNWIGPYPLTFKMYVKRGDTRVWVEWAGYFVGVIDLESPISSPDNFKLFVAAYDLTDFKIDKINITEGSDADMAIPAGHTVVVKDSFNGDSTALLHTGELNARYAMLFGDDPATVLVKDGVLRKPSFTEDGSNSGGERKFYLNSIDLDSGAAGGVTIEFDLVRYATASENDFVAFYKNGDNFGNADLIAQVGYGEITCRYSDGSYNNLTVSPTVAQNSTRHVKIAITGQNVVASIEGVFAEGVVTTCFGAFQDGLPFTGKLGISMYDSGDTTPSFGIDNLVIKGTGTPISPV